MHVEVQQSPAELQLAPSGRQAAVQTGTPLDPGWHSPRQQSAFTMQGVPDSRHAPGPGSHRSVAVSHTPEQQPIPASPPVQPSPEGRQMALESNVHTPLSQDPEQHSLSSWHVVPTTTQIAPPHTPPWHASEQQP